MFCVRGVSVNKTFTGLRNSEPTNSHGNVLRGSLSFMSLNARIAAVTRRSAVSGAEESDDESRRWAKRKQVNSNAQIIYPGVTTPYACIIRDVSSTGAKIEMVKNKFNPDGESSFIPAQFSLISPLDRTRVECTMMWRRGSSFGARFLSAMQQMPTPAKRSMIKRK